jgi:type II secretory pathway pseudopilin PulG
MVMATIGLIAAIAVPRYSWAMVRYRLDAASRRVVSDLALAQARAKMTSASQPVTFNTTTGTYQLTGVPDPDRRSTTYGVTLTAEPYVCKIVSAKFGSSSTVTFNGYGLPSAGGSIRISAGGTQRVITLDATTGVATAP